MDDVVSRSRAPLWETNGEHMERGGQVAVRSLSLSLYLYVAEVSFSYVALFMRRRDFTVNSLFYHLHDQTIEDYTNQVGPTVCARACSLSSSLSLAHAPPATDTAFINGGLTVYRVSRTWRTEY
jgi:hypothetical protein